MNRLIRKRNKEDKILQCKRAGFFIVYKDKIYIFNTTQLNNIRLSENKKSLLYNRQNKMSKKKRSDQIN